jgi:hypothetical protein
MSARRILPHPTNPFVDAVLAASGRYFGDKKYVTSLTVTLDTIPVVDLTALGYARPAPLDSLFSITWTSYNYPSGVNICRGVGDV